MSKHNLEPYNTTKDNGDDPQFIRFTDSCPVHLDYQDPDPATFKLTECIKRCIDQPFECIGVFRFRENNQCRLYMRSSNESNITIKLKPKPIGSFHLKYDGREEFKVDDRSKTPKRIIINFPFYNDWNYYNLNGIYNISTYWFTDLHREHFRVHPTYIRSTVTDSKQKYFKKENSKQITFKYFENENKWKFMFENRSHAEITSNVRFSSTGI